MDQNQWQISTPQTLEFDDIRSIKAGIIAGRVDILVHDEPVTRVEVSEVDGRPIDVTLTNGELEVVHTNGSSRGWPAFSGLVITGKARETAVISIAVPEGTAVALRTVSGDGLACGTSDTSLDTVSGSVMADDTSGKLRVNTVSGEAIVRHHTGPLVARTVSGEVTASGYCDTVNTNSVSGGISLDLLGQPDALEARTVSGNLTVRLSSEVGLDVTASSVSGSLVVNDHRFTGRGKSRHVEPGTTDAQLTVRASSVSGDVALFHRHPEYSPDGESAVSRDGGQ